MRDEKSHDQIQITKCYNLKIIYSINNKIIRTLYINFLVFKHEFNSIMKSFIYLITN